MSREPRPNRSAPCSTPQDHTRSLGGTAIVLLFLASGGLALVYEVLWQRQFALVFGSAAPATAAVLSAFLAGLGVGSLAGGTALFRRWAPLRVYALLEVGVALGALGVPLFLHLFERGFPLLSAALGDSPAVHFASKTLLTFFALGFPTACMGATLPALGRLLEVERGGSAVAPGLLYAVNTLGAALGAVSVPFLLLPGLGADMTLMGCVLGNLVIAAIAWGLDARRSRARAESPAGTAGATQPARPSPVWPNLLAWGSGMALFVLQVLWNRAFAQVHENSVYSFAVIAAVFIVSLAAGAGVARRLPDRRCRRDWVGPAWVVGGLLTAAGPWLFLKLTGGLSYLPADRGWTAYSLQLVGLASAILAPTALVLGIVLPSLLGSASSTGSRGQASISSDLGRLLAFNLLGSVSGALVAGFALPMMMSLWQGIFLVAGLLVSAGVVLLIALPGRRPSLQAVAAGVVVLVVVLVPTWRLDLPRVRLADRPRERLIALTEGPHGIVAVVEREGSRRLKLNNHYVLGGTASVGDERMQAHIPLLVHPAPRDVLFLGLGTAITASGSLFHPVNRITAIELVPGVVDAARVHFSEANAGFLEDARVRMVADDARSFLRGTRERFDVIIGDLVVPWRQGEGALFTLEQFEAARRCLNADGVFCQWIPLFQLSERELNILIRTFLQVFPNATLWRGDFSPGQQALALMGWAGESRPDPAVLARRLAQLKPDPSNPHLGMPELFWMYCLGPIDNTALPPGEVRINREDRPWIELLGPLDSMGEGGGRMFVGRRFKEWSERRLSVSKQALQSWGSNVWDGASAGDLLQEFSLRLSERNSVGAGDVQSRLRQSLSPPAFEALFGGAR